MREFFVDTSKRLPQLGLIHICCLVLFGLGLFLIYHYRDRIRELDPKVKKIFKKTVAVVMLLNMVIYYGSYLYYGVYDWHVHLPLHFCFISGNLFIIAMLFDLPKLYRITYFFAFMGPLPAIIWPDIGGGLDRFIFYQYVISHHIFLLASVFIYYADQPKMDKKDIRNAFLTAQIIFIIMIIFNAIFKTNYVMSKSLPEHFLNIYPFLKNFDYPIILLELAGAFIIFLAYIPIHFRNKELENREQQVKSSSKKTNTRQMKKNEQLQDRKKSNHSS